MNCWFGHKWSGWVENPDRTKQERWCKKCGFMEISKLPSGCEIGHDWSAWISNHKGSMYQRRTCKTCGIQVERGLW